MTHFKVGEIAIVVNVQGKFAQMNGRECEVVLAADHYPTETGLLFGYGIRIDGLLGTCVIAPHCLRKLPRDHNTPSHWSAVGVWKPEGVQV